MTSALSAAGSSFSSKHIAKQISEDIVSVTALKMELMIRSISRTECPGPVCSTGTVSEAAETSKAAKPTGSSSGTLSVTCGLIKGRMSELVVEFLLLRIT